MLAALLALAGFFLALYLTLHNLGYIGTLSCSIGGCERVQTSRWAWFLGIPVAAWGAGFYLTELALAIAGTTERWSEAPGLSALLALLAAVGVVFTLWLTWLELYVIHAVCMYCVGSAIIVTLLFVVALLDWREQRRLAGEE